MTNTPRTLWNISKYPHSRRNSTYVYATDAVDAIRQYAAMQYQSAAQRDGEGWRLGSVTSGEFRPFGPRLFVSVR